eukprot:gene235-852_t
MAANWEEIKRLASDLKRAQLSATSHKLSERNCIEIINKLTNLGLLEIIYTTDGREYLTLQQLEREIKDELIANGGRINLVDLQQITNVDLSYIENKVAELIKNDRSLILLQGDLINKEYLDRTAEEINESLQDAGQLTIGELSKTFNLPSEFLLSIIEPRLGSQIKGQLESLNRGTLFTESFVARNVAKIRGVLSAITRPTQIAFLVSQYGLSENFLSGVLSDLVACGRLAGSIQGRLDKAVFIPDAYTNTLNTWTASFFQQNGYMEYDTLQRLGISDGRQFLKRRLKQDDDSLLFLPTCCVGKSIQDHIEAVIDEALTSSSWVHVKPLLPSPFTTEDMTQLLNHCLKGQRKANSHLFQDGIIVSEQFINECMKKFHPIIKEKADTVVRTSPALFADLSKQERANLTESKGADSKQVKRDERHKKATLGGGQKGGAGRGGRETKTKKVKDKSKGRNKGQQYDSDDEQNDKKPGKSPSQMLLIFMSEEEIEDFLDNELHGIVDGLTAELASYLFRPLTQQYKEMAKSVFQSKSSSSDVKRKSHSEYQDKINGLYANIKLFEKGLLLLDLDSQVHLCKHLLKTLCQDVVNLLFEMVAAENLLTLADDESFTNETRLKLLHRLSGSFKGPLTKLNSSLAGKSMEEFFTNLETITGPDYCDVMLKKVDKKKERQLVFNHRQSLIDQLERETEPAMALHLVVVILFQFHTSCMIHAPGRCVPQIITFLKQYVTPESHDKLAEYQSLVMKQLTKKPLDGDEDGETVKENIGCLLAEGLLGIKSIATKPKKVGSSELS